MIKIDPNTRIIDLTVGELMELIESAQADKAAPQAPTAPEKRYVYGIAGIAQVFNCSTVSYTHLTLPTILLV